MRRIPHVSFECRLSNNYGRAVLRGIVGFARVRGPWDLRTTKLSMLVEDVKHWNIDGAIVCTAEEITSLTEAAGVPAVNVIDTGINLDLPRVTSDNIAVGQLGAEHFLERGFRQFAFSGISHEVYSHSRCAGFVRTLRAAGFDCDVCQTDRTAGDRQEKENSLNHWLKSLPKPVALMACHDRRAWNLVEICLRLKLRVPDQVAILGVGNDPFFCEMPCLSLSSIPLAADRIGYEAAVLLARLMKGAAAPSEPILIPPLGIVTRQSTDTLAIDDPDIAQAIRFIREHADKPVQVEDVLASMAMSRRVLEQRFRQLLKRSPHEEIRRVHVERAKTLLAESEMPMHEVAFASGFTDAGYFSRVFHEDTGVTPTSYRQRFGRGRSNSCKLNILER